MDNLLIQIFTKQIYTNNSLFYNPLIRIGQFGDQGWQQLVVIVEDLGIDELGQGADWLNGDLFALGGGWGETQGYELHYRFQRVADLVRTTFDDSGQYTQPSEWTTRRF